MDTHKIGRPSDQICMCPSRQKIGAVRLGEEGYLERFMTGGGSMPGSVRLKELPRAANVAFWYGDFMAGG